MISKVIYLCYVPLIHKREKDFYMDALIHAGISIEYWDLTNIFFPNIEYVLQIEREYVRKIKDYKELDKLMALQDNKHCIFVVMIVPNGMVIKLHRMLTKYDCCLIYFARSGIPSLLRNDSLLSKVVNNYRNYLRIEKITKILLNEGAKILNKYGLIKNYDVVFAAGSVEVSRYDKTSKVIHVNHFDYDNYLQSRNDNSRIIKDKYCVFLDDNIVYDTDYEMFNMQINSIPYFKSLCTFFDYLEDKYNSKVIVAAHPKAEYQGNEFGDRRIMKDKTNELVKDCHFTIAHYSTSIAFAVLYEKPLLIAYTKEMAKRSYFNLILKIADVLGVDAYDIDKLNNNEWIDIKEPDLSKYNNYKYSYLTSQISQGKLTKDIFVEYLCSHLCY